MDMINEFDSLFECFVSDIGAILTTGEFNRLNTFSSFGGGIVQIIFDGHINQYSSTFCDIFAITVTCCSTVKYNTIFGVFLGKTCFKLRAQTQDKFQSL